MRHTYEINISFFIFSCYIFCYTELPEKLVFFELIFVISSPIDGFQIAQKNQHLITNFKSVCTLRASKLMSAIFYQIFILSPNDSPWKMKNVWKKFFVSYIESSFCSRDIQIFVIFSLYFHTFQIQKGKWESNNLLCHEMNCINLQM